MPTARLLSLVALVSTLAGCQLFSAAPVDSGKPANLVRLQGELRHTSDGWSFRSCNDSQWMKVSDQSGADSAWLKEAAMLLPTGTQGFADLAGQKAAGSEYHVYRFYRVEAKGDSCNDPSFRRTLVHAGGNEPGWVVNAGNQGLVLERQDQPIVALPFLEERLPEGGQNLSSEANGQTISLWVAPQRCMDKATGNLYGLAAELRVNGEVHRGCAYYGGMRDE